jgi:DNA polymerase III delta subunit
LKLRSDNLAEQLRQPLLPVYLISGDEPLQVGEAADAVRAAARASGYSEREVHFIERGAASGASSRSACLRASSAMTAPGSSA